MQKNEVSILKLVEEKRLKKQLKITQQCKIMKYLI